MSVMLFNPQPRCSPVCSASMHRALTHTYMLLGWSWHPPQVAGSRRETGIHPHWELRQPQPHTSSPERRRSCVSEDNVAAPPFFFFFFFLLGQLYLRVHRRSSSGPPQTARLKRGALPPAGQARGQEACYPPPHSLPFCADFQREFLLFCVSQFIVVIFLSSGLTDTQYLNMNRAAAFAVSS